MPISRPSANRVLLAGLLGLAPCTAFAQPARQAIGNEGAEAMERLKNALQGAADNASAASGPKPPSLPHPAERRRAFDGLKRRAANPSMEARARAAQAAAKSGIAAERERQAKVLRQAFGLEPSEGQALAEAIPNAPSPAGNASSWVPVLFASSSMPVQILRSYAAQLERVRGVIAFRGVPGGMQKITPFAKLSADVLRVDGSCEGPACRMRDVQIVVDPIVFRRFDVSRVPALAMAPGNPTQPYCEREDEIAPATRPNAPLVYGDSALSGLLEEYARLGGKEEVRHAQALLANP